ncbi:MAG: dUTP diphosphatase [Flavobacteriales bacterium]|nr:dUTP diphosphatase [Flavobacteriales bacterium]NNK80980.1 dUTP diphosphatase [Flavobacteriales bacterium]
MNQVFVINRSNNPLPEYATIDSAGLDLRADISEPMIISSLDRILIPTGLYLALPKGTEAQIRPRSGMAYKKGITVLNSPGTIDADYRGEVKVLLVNLSKNDVTIEPGDRIAQMVIARYEKIKWSVVDDLEISSRGVGGFGHTGDK